MRRLITSLAILGVVLIAGMTMLVLLVNPNDFRNYMVAQVEQRSGYHLKIDGELRWHVWPQLSILTEGVTLTAPGAVKPTIIAGNMRLDVQLLPLLSHQLVVGQVMLKDAVLRLTPASQKQRPYDAPVEPAGQKTNSVDMDGWLFDIAKLSINDGLIIWQQPGGDEYNLRGVDMTLSQEGHRRVNFQLSSQINRNQQSLQFSLSGDLDASHYPDSLSMTLSDLNYQLSGIDLPEDGIGGSGTLTGEWQAEHQRLKLDNLSITANDSQLTGSLDATLKTQSVVNATLHIQNLNLDTLLGVTVQEAGRALSSGVLVRKGQPPVIAMLPKRNYRDSLFNNLDGNVEMLVDELTWRGMNFDQIEITATSHGGLITVPHFTGNYGDGNFSLPSTVDLRGDVPQTDVHLLVNNLDIASLLEGFNLPPALAGKLSAEGEFYGSEIGVDDIMQRWRGQAQVSISEAQLGQLNLVRMIQEAAERSDPQAQASDREIPASIKQLTAYATLDSGVLAFNHLHGQGSVMTLGGAGEINLPEHASDLRFDVTVNGNWRGQSQLIQRLQTTAIPLRIFGYWDNMHYSLHLDNILREQLRDEGRQRLERWLTQQKNRSAR